MSPSATVDVRSPVTSQSSSHQNPSFAPSFSSTDDHREGMAVPIFGNVNEFDAQSGLASRSGLRTGSVVSGRTRPRMAKLRKPLHGRSKGVSGEFKLGFNPFQSVRESPSSGNDCTSCSNGSSDKCMPKGVDCSSASFIFSASSSISTSSLAASLNLDYRERVFSANGNELNSEVELPKSDNVGFVFDVKPWQSNTNEGKSVSEVQNEKLHNVDFVSVASENNVEMKLDLENGESRNCGLESHSHNMRKVSFGTQLEHGKDSYVGFEFGVDQSNLESNLKFEKGESSGSAAKQDFNYAGFVFGAPHSNSSTNVGNSGAGFVFGASWFNSDDKFDHARKMRLEGEAVNEIKSTAAFETNGAGSWQEDNGKFPYIFVGSSNRSSSSRECKATNYPHEVKSNVEAFESCNSIGKDETGIPDFSIDGKCKPESLQNSNNTANASATNPVFNNLSDEMNKLNIDGYKNFDRKDNRKFVFRSNDTPSASYKDTTSHELDLKGFANAAKGSEADQFGSTDKTERVNLSSASIGTFSSETFRFHVGHATSSAENQLSHGKVNDDTQVNGDAASSFFSSVGLDSQAGVEFSKPAPKAWVENGSDQNSYTSTSDRFGVFFTDLETPKWDPSCLKASLFPEVNRKLEFSVKGGPKKDKKSKKMRGKLKPLSQHKQQQEKNHVENEGSAQEALNSPGCYSPMDFSPYEEITTAEKFSREASRTSSHSVHLDNHIMHSAASCLEDKEGLNLEKGEDINQESSSYHPKKCSGADSHAKAFVFEMMCSDHTEQVCSSIEAGVTSAGNASGLKPESGQQIQFGCAKGLNDVDGSKFSFSASSSAPNGSSTTKRPHRKKNRRKVRHESVPVAAIPNVKEHEGDLSTSQKQLGNNCGANELVKQSSLTSTAAIQEACETWRLRGNHAYKNGDLSEAEDFYTRGINSVPSSETSGCCLKPLVICYSNRAATRISLGKMREALRDCAMAATLDPKFLKVQMRAANCHLALGEVEKAQYYFNKCLESVAGVCLDRRIAIEAADGLQKAQKVAESTNNSARILDQRTSDAGVSALDLIAEALSISPFSERLLEIKAESLFMLRKYEEVIQLCEKTLGAAEKNFSSPGTYEQLVDKGGSQTESRSFAKLWRWRLISKTYFYLGRLEVALELLEKLEQMGLTTDKYASKILESSVSLAVTIRALFQHKNAGNEAVRSGRYTEAIEHYTLAISSNVESRPFAAICFCNRAAAHQALGQIADAIADCSLAIALDENYSKAVSRRATLHEMIRDYGQAATDLQRLVTILENPADGKARLSGTPSRSTSSKELRQARRRLSSVEDEAKKGIPLDLYLILGVKQSDTTAEMKKAYRKAALRHHPDKAGQFLARSESGDEGRLWKDIFQEVHNDADRLFKMIGEAYAVLSDPTKRSQYELDEEIRKASKENNGSYPSRRTSDSHSYSYGRGEHRRNWPDNWKTYGHSHSRW